MSTVPFPSFATSTIPIPLSELDANFATINTGSYSVVASSNLSNPVFTVPTYVTGNNSLKVYVDGVKQIVNSAYTETNSTTVTFASALHPTAVVEFTG